MAYCIFPFTVNHLQQKTKVRPKTSHFIINAIEFLNIYC